MVLINDKKFACATCIKGHRVSGCTHTDRPLFEVKKKGRPTTQCVHCKDKRKKETGSVHTKCMCGDVKPPTVIMPSADGTVAGSSSSGPSTTVAKEADAGLDEDELREIETRKGQPGSKPTFPNGFRDVHEMSAAAEVLTDLNEATAMKQAERSVHMLLNPCNCRTGGICKCCHPKRPPATSHKSDGSASPSNPSSSAHGSPSLFPTNPLADPSSRVREHPSMSGASTPTLQPTHSPTGSRFGNSGAGTETLLSPENMHHPAHTSRHVHKTKLYSPYSTSGHSTPRHAKRDSLTGSTRTWPGSQASASRSPPPPSIRPLVNLKSLLGAVIKEDGSIANEIPRSALGLPGISTFDAAAENGGVKIEPMEMDVDPPVHFPTSEDVVVGGCTCEDDCDCPGCPTHNIPSRADHSHSGACGAKCTSSFECRDRINIPPGITSIQHLLSVAAAHVPPPARPRSMSLNAHDTAISPPAVHVSEDAARSLGVVKLKPLECCNGRCQCKPGSCSCEKDCCGCCIRCACAEDAESSKTARQASPSASATSTGTSETASPGKQGSSCCSGKADQPVVAPINTQPVPDRDLLSPESASTATGSHQPPQPSRSSTPQSTSSTSQPVLRRATSISQSSQHVNSASGSHRRATVTAPSSAGGGIQRSASTGKSASKALALHQQPNHPRAILPKPSLLGVPKQAGSSSGRNPSPTGRRTSSSAVASRSGSPGPGQSAPAPNLQHRPSIQITPTGLTQPSISFPDAPASQLSQSSDGGLPQQVDFSALASDPVFMAYMNEFAASGQQPSYPSNPASTEMFSQYNYGGGRSGLDGQPMPAPPPSAYDVDATMSAIDLDLSNGMTFDEIIAQMMADGQGQAPQVEFSQPQQQTSNPPSRDPYDYNGFGQQGTYAETISAQSGQSAVASNSAHSQNVDQQVQNMLDMMSGQTSDHFWAWQQQQQQPNNAGRPQQGKQITPSQVPAGQPSSSQPLVASDSRSASASLPPSRPSGPAVGTQGSTNPDIIDLSKPLDAQDVERILRALQRQQSSQEAGRVSAPQTLEVQAPAPSGPDYSQIYNQNPGQRVGAAIPPPPPLQPAYSDSAGSVFTSSASADDTNDPFDSFVFDNPGEALDFSQLDLGGQHSRNTSVSGQGNRDGQVGYIQRLGEMAGMTPSFDQMPSGPASEPGQEAVDWEKMFTAVGAGSSSTNI